MNCLIQARSSSKRFPNKVLKKLHGKEILLHVFDRLKKSRKIKKIMVVTSLEKSDDKIIKLCRKNNISYFRGSLKNVALRYLKAAKKIKTNSFLRVCDDSPLLNSRLIDKIIVKFNTRKFDLVTNIFPRTFPKGQSIEILKTKILNMNISKFNKYELEHVTPFFYNNSKKFKIYNYKSKKNLSKLNLSIDTNKDLIFLKKNFQLKDIKY